MLRIKFYSLLAALVLLAGCAKIPTPATEPVTEPPVVETTTEPIETTTAPTEPQPEHFYLTFAGDCTLGSNPLNYYADLGFIKTVGEDMDYPFRNVYSYFTSDDFTMVNLEGPLCDTGYPVEKKHVFHGPTTYTAILTQNSVEAVTIANNHTLDYGNTGYESTRQVLDAVGIPFVERDSTRLLTTDSGLTIGLYGMMYYKLDVDNMVQSIADLKERGAEIVIVAPHWGVEGSYRPTKEQVDVGHAAIDAGADIIFGSHPHVLQPVEVYGDGIIYYSLGNFSFGGNCAPDDLDTALLRQEVIRDPDGSIRLGELERIPACISSEPKRNNFQPTPENADSDRYRRVLQKLDGSFDGPNLKIH